MKTMFLKSMYISAYKLAILFLYQQYLLDQSINELTQLLLKQNTSVLQKIRRYVSIMLGAHLYFNKIDD